MKKLWLSLAMLLAAGMLNGCATLFGDSTQSVYIDTSDQSEQEATLIDGSGSKNITIPRSVTVTKGTEQPEVRLKGECGNSTKVERGIAGPFWLNIISGGLFGSAIDYITGKMWNYSDTVVQAC